MHLGVFVRLTSKRTSCPLSILLLLSMGVNYVMPLSSGSTGNINISKSLNWEFHVAPMQGYTNKSLRTLFHNLSPHSILWTEMEKVQDLMLPNDDDLGRQRQSVIEALNRRLGIPQQYDEESHLILQLGSSDPNQLKSCLKHTLDHYNFREINLNCGCPSIESGGASTYGASLMKEPELTGRLLSTIKECCDESGSGDGIEPPKVSLKCRIGVHNTIEELYSRTQTDEATKKRYEEEDYAKLHNYIQEAVSLNNSVDHIILHARPAILSGLNPTKNRIVPQLDYDIVERISSDFANVHGRNGDKLRFTLNGGIQSLDDLMMAIQRDESNVHSHMAGRWCLRRPLDLVGVEEFLLTSSDNDDDDASTIASSCTVFDDTKDAVKSYVQHVLFNAPLIGSSTNSYSATMGNLCLPLYLILEQLKEDYSYYFDDDVELYHRPLLSVENIEELYNVLLEGVIELQSMSGKNGGGGKKNKKQKKSLSQSGLTGDLNWKQMEKAFKGLVGTKVVNKWKRNRTEL